MTADLPDFLVDYLMKRDADRAQAVTSMLASLTDRERALVKDAAVMGYIRGTMHPQGQKIPRDREILAQVIDACLTHPDLYPAVNADPQQAPADAESLPARPGDNGVATMYNRRRAAEFDRLRELMAEAIHEDAQRVPGERVGIINAILAIRQLQRPFEERDRLRAGARYWIDYACAYAEGKDRAEAALERARALHQRNPEADYCDLCSNHGDINWPCATITALNTTQEA